ncbi:recombinase family protein [Caenispirillum salinarum]|uniref:recombinase family protein n=1 Tax=Caenispirillum salinarum TaxID=859058 RepID=UPI00384FD569
MSKRVAFYIRVSTDGQTVANQLRELHAVAERLGWHVVTVFEDAGISGAKGRDQRPGFDALMKGVTRREFDLIAAWSVCRLGRSLQHLVGFLSEINERGVDLYLHQQGLDTSTPAGRAMFGMLGVFSEFERAMITDRIRSGVSRARDQGKHCGRPSLPADKREAVERLLAEGTSIAKTAKAVGVGVATVHRIKQASATAA